MDELNLEPTSAERDSIVADHKELTELLRRLGAVEVGQRLDDLLTLLRITLDRHFAHEEGADGVFAVIEHKAPRHRQQVQDLRATHRTILDDVSGLLERTGAEPAGAALVDEVARLTRRIHEHEQEESQLWIDTLSTDLGEGD